MDYYLILIIFAILLIPGTLFLTHGPGSTNENL
uniref:Uncharacterized protein n=1 Tax=viral metagenome TaxID=1070528 RepID=A0A6C0KTH8_9ZZZZ